MLDLPILCKGCPQEASGFQDYAVCQFDWCHPGVKHVCLERGFANYTLTVQAVQGRENRRDALHQSGSFVLEASASPGSQASERSPDLEPSSCKTIFRRDHLLDSW